MKLEAVSVKDAICDRVLLREVPIGFRFGAIDECVRVLFCDRSGARLSEADLIEPIHASVVVLDLESMMAVVDVGAEPQLPGRLQRHLVEANLAVLAPGRILAVAFEYGVGARKPGEKIVEAAILLQ